MSYFGILAILAKEYKTELPQPEQTRSLVNDLRFVRIHDYSQKEPEYRAWLFVSSLDGGLYIKQRRVLNIFPRKMLIPWSYVTLSKVEKKLFGYRYFYEVHAANQLFYLISKHKLAPPSQ